MATEPAQPTNVTKEMNKMREQMTALARSVGKGKGRGRARRPALKRNIGNIWPLYPL